MMNLPSKFWAPSKTVEETAHFMIYAGLHLLSEAQAVDFSRTDSEIFDVTKIFSTR